MIQLGRWDEALECRDKLVELNPNDYHLWFFKSFDLISLKKYTDAIRCIDKAIELNIPIWNQAKLFEIMGIVEK